jgi:hypothetical protein
MVSRYILVKDDGAVVDGEPIPWPEVVAAVDGEENTYEGAAALAVAYAMAGGKTIYIYELKGQVPA